MDQFNNLVKVFDSAGRFVFALGGTGVGDGEFSNPSSIALNKGGTAYVTDWHGDRIEKFKISGLVPMATPAATS